MQAGIAADKERQFDTAIAEIRKVTELDPAYTDGIHQPRPSLYGKNATSPPPLRR